ncbi:MAG: hypothetical protein U0792_19285 [Gemmataceae bacterium]
MIRSALLLNVVFVGCSQNPEQSPAAPTAEVTAAVAAVASDGSPNPIEPIAARPQPQPKPPEPPTVFDYPADLGGKAVVKAVTPTVTTPLATEKVPAATPKPQTPPSRLLDPDPITKATYVPPPVLPPKPAEARLTAPPERVPVDLGWLAEDVPAKPTFPVAAGISERARDVKLPPALPILGRPFTERVSLDDPTAEFGNAGIVAPLVKVQVPQAGFLRVSLPDPFELGEQVKPRVPPTADPGLTPVVVNPQRVK